MYLGEVVIYGPVLFLHAFGSAGCVQNFPVSNAEVIFSFGSASVKICFNFHFLQFLLLYIFKNLSFFNQPSTKYKNDGHTKINKNLERFTNLRVILAQGPC